MADESGWIDLGDGIRRLIVKTREHPADGGMIREIVVGGHGGGPQDDATLSVYEVAYLDGTRGARLYPSIDEALHEFRQHQALGEG